MLKESKTDSINKTSRVLEVASANLFGTQGRIFKYWVTHTDWEDCQQSFSICLYKWANTFKSTSEHLTKANKHLNFKYLAREVIDKYDQTQ